jgi:hypothetical protein
MEASAIGLGSTESRYKEVMEKATGWSTQFFFL